MTSQGAYDANTGVWDVGALGPGQSAELTIAGNISPTAQDGALLVNTVSVGSDQEDIDLSDNTTTTTTTVQVLKVDLQATKTAGADLVVAGEQLTYTITVTNKASTTASGVRVTDSLPINVNFLSDLPRQGSYDSTTNIWTVGTLGPGQSAQLTLEVIVASTTPDGAAPVNTVVAESDQIDDDLSDNTTTTTTTVEMLKVDLEVTKQADVDPVVAGEQLTYTITVTNLALTAATGVRVTEALPTQVSFVSGVTSEGDYDSNTQVWTVGDLGSGQDAQLTLEVLVASTTPDGAVLLNSASATSDQVDLDPSDNTTTTSTNVNVVEIDLAVTKQSSLGSDIPGGEFTYTIGVTNNSQETASGVTVSDSLLSEVALLTSTATRGQYDSGTGLWTVGVLVPGQSETLTLEVRVDAEAFGVITNTAVASSDKPDPQPQNNAATAQVFVLPPPTDQTVQIPMGVGFNLIGLPVRFPAPLTAREFSDLVDAQGGTVAAILRWDAGYEAWLKDFPDQKNFVLEEGRGYFVRLSKSPANDQLSVTGAPFTVGVPVDIGVGFNLLSVPFASPAGGYDSRTLVQAIDPNGLDLGGVVAAVLSWAAGYEVYLTDFPDQKIFPIEAFWGYFIRMAQERLGFVP